MRCPEMFPEPESPQARGARALVMLASGARAAAAEAAAPLLKADPATIPPDRQRLLGLACSGSARPAREYGRAYPSGLNLVILSIVF